MTRKKVLPYAAAGMIDDATMALAVAHRFLCPLLDKTDLETVARAGRALVEINRASAKLSEVRLLTPEKEAE